MNLYQSHHELRDSAHVMHLKNLCKKHHGAYVEVEVMDGKVYHGKIHHHDHENVYIVVRAEHDGQMESSSHINKMYGGHRFFPGLGFGFGAPFFAGPFGPGFGLFGFPFFGIRRFRRFWW